MSTKSSLNKLRNRVYMTFCHGAGKDTINALIEYSVNSDRIPRRLAKKKAKDFRRECKNLAYWNEIAQVMLYLRSTR